MLRSRTALLMVLGTVVIGACSRSASSADPKCANGIRRGVSCCPPVCGRCGGPTCAQVGRLLGTRCCPSGIENPLNYVPRCKVSNPPCLIRKPPIRGGGRSSVYGNWRKAPVRRGKPYARHEACSAFVNGQLVLIGGRGINKPTSIYNPRTQKWRTAAGPGPGEQLHHFQCVVANGSIWAVASWKGIFPNEKNNEFVFEYKVRANKWRKHPGMPAHRNRGGAAAVRRGPLIIVVAGNRGGHGKHAKSLPWVDAFNWRTKRWIKRKFADMPDNGRDHVGGAMVKKMLCIAGGRNGGADKFFKRNLASTFCYNFRSDSWLRKPNLPRPRAGANTARTCDGRMMVAGGEGNGVAYNRVDVFNGTHWQKAPRLVSARHSSGLTFARCKKCAHAFIPSGSGGQGGRPELITTEEFIPSGSPIKCRRY